MLKKLIVGGVLAGGLLVVLFGRGAASYVGTTAGRIKESVKGSVPIEFEIDRARGLVRDIVPDIRTNMHLIAKEEVEVERLDKEITESEARLGTDRSNLMRLQSDLKSDQSVFQYAGRSYSKDQVKIDLANRFERYKTHDATLNSLREMHRARLNSLEAARQKLEGMLAAKRQLEVDVEHLEARLKMVEAAQTTSDYNFDDSRLSRAKDLIGDLRTRLDVAERMVNAEGYFKDEIPLAEPVPENIVDEVTEYFEVPGSQVAKASDETSR